MQNTIIIRKGFINIFSSKSFSNSGFIALISLGLANCDYNVLKGILKTVYFTNVKAATPIRYTIIIARES